MTLTAFQTDLGIKTFSGSPKEIGESLEQSHDQSVVLVTIDNIQQHELDTLSSNLSQLMSTMYDSLKGDQEPEALHKLVELMMPGKPVSPRLLRKAQHIIKAKTEVLESGDWLTAQELAKLAGLSTRNPSAQPNKWKKQGHIFAIHHKGSDYFPGYTLDPDKSYRPVKGLKEIIKVFEEHKDSWGMAFWFCSGNSFLGGQRPQDLLIESPARVLDAAKDEVAGVLHG